MIIINQPLQLWSAKVSTNFTQLFVNGHRATRARTPNLGVNFYWQSTPCTVDNTCRATDPGSADQRDRAKRCFTFYPGDASALAPLGSASGSLNGKANAVVYHGWTASRHYVQSVDVFNRTIFLSNPSERPIGYWKTDVYAAALSEGGGRYYVENFRDALDAKGEWWLDDTAGTVWYAPTALDLKLGAAATTARAPRGNGDSTDASTMLELLRFENVSDVSWRGIKFAHAAWGCGVSETCDHQSAAWQTFAAIHVRGSSSILFEDISVVHVGGTAIWIDANSTNVSIISATLADLGAGGVRIGCGGNPHLTEACFAAPSCNVTVLNTSIARGGIVTPSGTGK